MTRLHTGNEAQRQLYESRKAAGTCVRCPFEQASEGSVMGPLCLERMRKQNAKRYKKRGHAWKMAPLRRCDLCRVPLTPKQALRHECVPMPRAEDYARRNSPLAELG